MDNRETLKALVELAKKATPGPWHGFEDKFGPSREDHGYRLLAEFSRRKGTAWALYGEASAMWVPGNGWTWGEDIQFVIAARNAIPALEALLAEPSSSAMAAARDPGDFNEWRSKCWEAAKVAMSAWTGLTEQHRHEIAEDVVTAFEHLAPKHMQIPEGQWMPIESAPKGNILLYTKATTGRSPLQALIRIGYKGDWPYRETTHWMPLPAPPKGDEPESLD